MSVKSTIRKLISPDLEKLGFELVKIDWPEEEDNRLQIMVDRKDGGRVSLGDCSLVSKTVSELLDLNDPIEQRYVLEVSSPGIDRPLIKLEDFERFSGFRAHIKMRKAQSGRKKFKGILVGLEGESVKIRVNKEVYLLSHSMIESAKLLMSQELLEPMAQA